MKIVNKNSCLWLVLLTLLFSVKSAYATIQANHKTSLVKFSGQHAGMTFTGEFQRWQAQLLLPPAANAKINATFYLESAKTGDSIYDSTLEEFDWFNIEEHPTGTFVSNQITAINNGYQVTGTLTLKNITKPVSFKLITEATMLTATFNIDRLAYNIGLDSDPDAEWVSKNIAITMQIKR